MTDDGRLWIRLASHILDVDDTSREMVIEVFPGGVTIPAVVVLKAGSLFERRLGQGLRNPLVILDIEDPRGVVVAQVRARWVTVGTTHRTPDVRCLEPTCRALLTGASGIRRDAAPEPGSVSICIECGHIAIFGDDMTLRELTSEEMHEVAGHPIIIEAQAARANLPPRKP